VVVDGAPPPKPPRVGRVTPWSFKQLRYAANWVLLPPGPPVPPNFGRRLAHALLAVSNFACSEGDSVVRVVDPPPVPVPPPPPPGPPPPPKPPPPKPPAGRVTPWDLRQLVYAVNDDFAELLVVVEVDAEAAAFDAPLLHAPKSTPRTPTESTNVVSFRCRLILGTYENPLNSGCMPAVHLI
jgi:hypothetical protein